MKLKKNIFLLLLFLSIIFSNAQELPPIQNYSSKDYGGKTKTGP